MFFLVCSSNQLTSLDLSNNKLELRGLVCEDNLLTSLDFSGFYMLASVYCSSNQLTSLNLNNCYSLHDLLCSSNRLTHLDLSTCKDLMMLDCSSNLLETLDVSNTSLPYSGGWQSLYCAMETLKILYLRTGWNIPGITTDRSPDCIADHTEIVFVD